jgi:hypothetical protein
MKLENIFLLLITSIFLSLSVKAENPNNWITYLDDANLLIEYQYQNCEYERFDEEKILLKITNKIDKDIFLSWKEVLWYDQDCINCNLENENELFKSITLKANQFKEGTCERNNPLTIFSKFSERLIDMPGVSKIVELTKFELKKIKISYE